MSKSFVEFSCNQCNFDTSSIVLWGIHNYQVGNDLIPIEKTLGWCSECCTLVPIEVLPTYHRVDSLKSEIALKESIVLSHRLHHANERPWYMRLLNAEIHLPEGIQDIDYEVSHLKNNLETEKRRLAALAVRRSPARCLKCGSTAIVSVPITVNLYPSDTDHITSTSIGFTHPNCGGLIIATPSQMRASMRLLNQIFNTDGNFLVALEK